MRELRAITLLLAAGLTLALGGCSEPPKADGTLRLVITDKGTARTASKRLGFTTLIGCNAAQILETNAGPVRVVLELDGERAKLVSLGIDRAMGFDVVANPIFESASGDVTRSDLGNNREHLRIRLTATNGSMREPGADAPWGSMDKAQIEIEGDFTRIAAYGFGGMTACGS